MLRTRVHAFLDVRVYPRIIRATPGVDAPASLRARGMPLLQVADGARVVLAENVLLNSRNHGYHVNMHSPVKLLADRPGAEIVVGANTEINGTCIHAYESIHIGSDCLIAANTQIMDGSGHDASFPDVARRRLTGGGSSPIVIEDCVWIGANCVVLPGTRIGRGSIVGAGSVVRGVIPPGVLAAGNPARVVRRYEVQREAETESPGAGSAPATIPAIASS
jgi:carbonic anhydrase/acetyltransferase-like protein (isoleucine patch superfamily)